MKIYEIEPTQNRAIHIKLNRIARIFQLELLEFADQIGHFLPGIVAKFRGFTKIKKKYGMRQNQQTIAFKPVIKMLCSDWWEAPHNIYFHATFKAKVDFY